MEREHHLADERLIVGDTSLASEIDRRLQALSDKRTESLRGVRREYSKRLRRTPADQVLRLARDLVSRHRWFAYELVYHHPEGLSILEVDQVERLGLGIDSWLATDAFGRYISGPTWQRGLIADDVVHRWAASEDRWWRRAALVSTVPLNLRSAGGTGDPRRTLAVCRRLVSDRDDMVVKGLSWALRELVVWDRDAVRTFVDANADELASRVTREVDNKLRTGLKNPCSST